MTPQADWVKEFRKRFVHKGEVGGSFEVAGEPSKDIEDFISKVESLAQQRTEKKIVLGLEELANTKLGKSVYQDGIRQGIKESQKYISDLNN